MAILKHIAGKNNDYGAAYDYLVFDHDERTGKKLLDPQGFPVIRDKYLIEGLYCMPETFALECRKTNRKYHKNTKPEEIKTHHYIISFDPKDRELGLTMEKAQKLGMEYAARNFPGHQAIVATHDDGNGNHSGNIHCHIIINSVRAMDVAELPYDSRPCDQRAGFKHNCTKSLLRYLEDKVVKMCVREGYHQVDFEKSDQRITNSEYKKVHREHRSKKPDFQSDKEQLRVWIDEAMASSTDEKSFRKYLLEHFGIEVTESRGKWGYRMQGKEKSVRARKLGDRYEKENVLPSLAKNAIESNRDPQEEMQLPVTIEGAKTESAVIYEYQITITLPVHFGKIIDIEGNQKIKNSPAYAQWAKIHNLQIQAEQFAYLSERGLINSPEVEQEYQKVSGEYQKVHGELKSVEAEIKTLNQQLRLLGQYYSTRKEWKDYNRSGRAEAYYLDHKSAIELHEKALDQLKEMYEGKRFPNVKDLKEKKRQLQIKRKKLSDVDKQLKGQVEQIQSLLDMQRGVADSDIEKQKKQYANCLKSEL